MAESGRRDEITELLHPWRRGSDVLNRLIPLVYDELHVIASRQLVREGRTDRPDTTAVVHEAYVRLFAQRDINWQNRDHFLAIAARLMRRILVDHARRRLRQKRGAGTTAVEVDDTLSSDPPALDAADALDLDRALRKLRRQNPHQGRIVELRFFAGLTVQETAARLNISPATVKREWAMAKEWLHRELGGGMPPRRNGCLTLADRRATPDASTTALTLGF